MSKYFGFILLLVLAVNGLFGQKNKFVPTYSTILPNIQGPIVLRQCSRSVPEKVESYFELATTDIQNVENNFKKILSVKATGCCLIGGKIKKLEGYGFQYLGIVIGNQKYIYINAFRIETPEDITTFYKNWKSEPIMVCDGGVSFWGVLFDVEKKLFCQLSINGEG